MPRGKGRTGCTDHCAACNAHFSSVEAFDAHRQGTFEPDTRHCVDPEDVKDSKGEAKLVPRTEDGICKLQRGGPVEGVVVWTAARAMTEATRARHVALRAGVSAVGG